MGVGRRAAEMDHARPTIRLRCARAAHLPPAAELTRNPPEGLSVGTKNENLFEWEVMIVGLADTPLCVGRRWAGGGPHARARARLRDSRAPGGAHPHAPAAATLALCSEGGFFKAELKFPDDFPNKPPTMKFISPMWHPNSASAPQLLLLHCGPRGAAWLAPRPAARTRARALHPRVPTRSLTVARAPTAVYPDGTVCISILHPPGVDRFNTQESADERWRPILGVEQVLVSVMAMMNEPNIESPANIDAAKMFRDDPKAYKKKVRECAARTLEG